MIVTIPLLEVENTDNPIPQDCASSPPAPRHVFTTIENHNDGNVLVVHREVHKFPKPTQILGDFVQKVH